MLMVFNLAQLSAIRTSFSDAEFLLAYFLKSLSLKILFKFFTISKNPIFLAKNKLTSSSFYAFTMVGANFPKFKHFEIKLIEGNFFLLTF